MAQRDYIDELIEKRTKENPDFPRMVEAASRRRHLLRTLGEERRSRERSQTQVAADMHSSQSSIARLEGSANDARLSTVERFAEAVGLEIQYHLVPVGMLKEQPPVVVHPE